MAQEVIAFLERCSVPNISFLVLLFIVISDNIYSFLICRMSDKYMKEEIKELKEALKQYESNNN